MVRPLTIAGASFILLLSAARFSGAPAVSDEAHTPAEMEPLPVQGPVDLSTAVSAHMPSEHVAKTANRRTSALGAKLQFIALYGDPTQMTIPLMDFSSGIDSETLWLARAIYSETKQVHEQELVAWVIRNRVDTGYRSQHTYEGVVLDPYQFSAFNPGSPKRAFYTSLTPTDSLPGWQRALRIAHYVRHAEASQRPFSIKTRHFYSERSMVGRAHPYWANDRQLVMPNWTYRVDERRFRFYEAIS